MTQPRLYLLSKKIDLSDEDLEKSAFSNSDSEDIDDTHSAHADDGDDKESATIITISDDESKLIGTSSQRESLKNEQDKAYKESLLADIAKTKKQEDNMDGHMDQSNKKDRAMQEFLKAARSRRVPPEQSDKESCQRVKIAIRHPTLGLKSRWFLSNESMMAVYDFCGSLSLEPMYFTLGTSAGCFVKPTECVDKYHQVLLHVCPETNPVCIEEESSEPTITFKGFGPLPDNTCNDDTLRLPAIGTELPDVIISEDDDKKVRQGNFVIKFLAILSVFVIGKVFKYLCTTHIFIITTIISIIIILIIIIILVIHERFWPSFADFPDIFFTKKKHEKSAF